MTASPTHYRFSFGPWNISEGSDPFGPEVRKPFPEAEKLALFRQLGFEGIQLHDDDAIPGLDALSPAQIQQRASELRTTLANAGLTPEFVAPRLWFSEHTIDGAYTSNDPGDRAYAWERTQKSIDIAKALDCKALVLWLSREGTYLREAKDARLAYERILETINRIL
ncbi:MAG: hypothetical protein RLZZ142_538, partial [Verrucomicrobiota bacterium]